MEEACRPGRGAGWRRLRVRHRTDDVQDAPDLAREQVAASMSTREHEPAVFTQPGVPPAVARAAA
jgi:hypothetical protein